MKPLYFGECFGWLHAANGARGVVICSALGIEELCTHRFMRQLACETAAAGMPTLRFDYQGTGDSAGSDLDSDRVEHWLDSVRQAVAYLRRETLVTEIALVGFRLGALLATRVAEELADVDSLALLAPVTSGRRYLREMQALGTLIAQSARTAEPADAAAGQDRGIETAGFVITPQTMSTLERIDLLRLERKPASRVLVLGKPESASDLKLCAKLNELGCAIENDVLPGYAEMEWNSSLATLPDDAFSGLVRWLSRDLPAGIVHIPEPAPAILNSRDWQETPVTFGPDGQLFAIRCDPPAAKPKQSTAVLFVNHGANHHIGWARMYVALARRFAAQGITSLRIDIAGVGDSPARAGKSENVLYDDDSQDDIRAALDYLQREGYEQGTLVGHCAGAYVSFYAAVQDPRIKGLVMLNLQRFFWNRGDSLEIAMRSGFRSTRWYLATLRDPEIWRRLLLGKIHVAGISKAVAQRFAKRLYHVVKDMSAAFKTESDNPQQVVQWFRALSQRATRVLLVYSAEDGGLDEIALHGGSNGKNIRKLPHVQFQIIEGADHNLTPAWAYEKYARILEEYLGIGRPR